MICILYALNQLYLQYLIYNGTIFCIYCLYTVLVESSEWKNKRKWLIENYTNNLENKDEDFLSIKYTDNYIESVQIQLIEQK